MNFIKYPSLTNHYQMRHIEQCLNQQVIDKWQVFEKIHGSNFALYVSKDGIKAASRNKFLTSEDKFHGFQDIIKQYRESLESLHKDIGDFIMYGELYGGNIQKEIRYGDKPMFRVFDIYLYHVEEFLFFDYIREACAAGIPIVSPLFEGTLQECLEFNPNFKSKYSESKDMAEGVVIKPCVPFVLTSGSMPWIKNKTDAFKEKKDQPKVSKVISDRDPFILATYLAYVCEARLNNVKSKMTEDEMTIPNLANSLFQDVLDDISDEGIEWDKKYQKPVLGACFKLVRENM